jgi:hypothetical protein
MKNFYLVLLLFISQERISPAQVYHPFPDTLAQWSEGSVYSGMCCSGSGYLYTTAGDTIIQIRLTLFLGTTPPFHGILTSSKHSRIIPMKFPEQYSAQYERILQRKSGFAISILLLSG